MPPLAPLCLLGTLPQHTAPRFAAKRKHGSRRQEGKSKWALRPAWLGPHSGVTSGGLRWGCDQEAAAGFFFLAPGSSMELGLAQHPGARFNRARQWLLGQ